MEEELKPTGKIDVFVHTASDIPEGAKKIVSVKNRPYTFGAFGLIALLVFFIAVPKYWIAYLVTAIAIIAVVMLVKDIPVLDIYEGFLVCHSKDDPDKLCIIADDELIYWSVIQEYSSIVQLFFNDRSNIDNALCVNLHSINSYKVISALEKHYLEKSLSEIRKGVERKNRQKRRAERKKKGK
ncbi:MAG: hypothetical protein J5796_00480 [Erysipelotrichaceae bacterium]|nr:hypothetical protein [Erysipelotrichaceae bacterium]